MRKKPWLAIALSIALIGLPVRQARAQFVVTDPALQGTTLLMKAQQVLQFLKEAQTAINALQMVNMMIREGKNLAQHPSTNITNTLGNLAGILSASQGLAGDMATMDAQFRQAYGVYNGPDQLISYGVAYNKWATTSMNSIRGAVDVAGYQGSMLGNEQLFMGQVSAMAQTPQGQMEALQLGNTIGIEMIAQLQKLRQLMIADMSAKAAFTAQQVGAQQSQQAAAQAGFAYGNWSADPRTW